MLKSKWQIPKRQLLKAMAISNMNKWSHNQSMRDVSLAYTKYTFGKNIQYL